MPMIGGDDEFESRYMARLRAILTEHGVTVTYEKDRAAIDTGLHLFIEGPLGRHAVPGRVWFQAKGKRQTSLCLADYSARRDVEIRVPVDHVRFWYAAPEPVYLTIYVEAVDQFIAEDVRDIVDRQWPNGSFYSTVPECQKSVTLHVDTSMILNDVRLEAMLAHRSMRIDGPSFRGRPLGHRFDPLRSQISVGSAELWSRLVTRILAVHDFREKYRKDMTPDLCACFGRLYQTLEWQSPAFAEYGYGSDDDLRQEPPIFSVHGDVVVILDLSKDRKSLTTKERASLQMTLGTDPGAERAVVVLFNGKERSGTRGVWRSALDDLGAYRQPSRAHLLGLESITSLLLVATLVYLEFAPELSWGHASYQS